MPGAAHPLCKGMMEMFWFVLILEEPPLRVHTKSLCKGYDHSISQLEFVTGVDF